MVGDDYRTVTIWSVNGRCRGWGDGAAAPARRRALRATWRNNSLYTLELKCLAYDVRIYQNCTNYVMYTVLSSLDACGCLGVAAAAAAAGVFVCHA